MHLTELEQKTLDFIVDTIVSNGYSPSVRDIKEALGYKSTSTVYHCLLKLEQEGLISRQEGKSRTIRVENLLSKTEARIPVLGRVAAGLPAMGDGNYDGYINFIAESVGYNQSNLIALKITNGDMREEGILKGDIVIVDRREYAQECDIIAAVRGEETVVMRNAGGAQDENHTIIGTVVACIRIY